MFRAGVSIGFEINLSKVSPSARLFDKHIFSYRSGGDGTRVREKAVNKSGIFSSDLFNLLILFKRTNYKYKITIYNKVLYIHSFSIFTHFMILQSPTPISIIINTQYYKITL